MNPAEHAPALQQIYEARLELVRQNEAEIADLKDRLQQATKRNKELVAQMRIAKDNYKEAASKIVDLLEEDGDANDEEDDDRESNGNASKDSLSSSRGKKASKTKKKNKTHRTQNDDNSPSDRTNVAGMPSPLDDEDDRDNRKANSSKNKSKRNDSNNSSDRDGDTKPPALERERLPSRMARMSPSFSYKPNPSNYAKRTNAKNTLMGNEVVELLESSDEDTDTASSTGHATKRSRSSSPATTPATRQHLKNDPLGATKQKRAKSASPRDKDSEFQETVTGRRLRSAAATSRANPEDKSATGSKKRTTSKKSSSSSSTAFTRRIKLRPRPSDIPPERWLKSSVGRTREELNSIDDMVQYMGSCKFNQSVVMSKFGKVHAMILNDEWNALAQRNDEYQIWYVGLGPGRKRDARLVGASQTTIPIFHAPKMEYTTRELFYVGHYRVKDLEELDPPIVEMEKERDVRVTLAFAKFDERLDGIIKRGPQPNTS